MKTKIISLQFAYFLRDIVERPDLEFSSLNSKMLNVFDAMPQILPIPRELPTDVPVMVLKSSSGEYSCNISRSRIDFFYNRIDESKSNTAILSDFNAKVSGLTSVITSKQEVTRFGMVARYFHHDNTAIHTIRKKFFTSSVDGAEELGLRMNKPAESHGFKINDIIEVNAAEMQFNGRTHKGVLVQRDINNNAKQSTPLNSEVLKEISLKFATRIAETEIERLIK